MVRISKMRMAKSYQHTVKLKLKGLQKCLLVGHLHIAQDGADQVETILCQCKLLKTITQELKKHC